jgi:hypothetical protein
MNRATGYLRIVFLPLLLAGLLGSSSAFAATRGSHASSSRTRSTSSSHVTRPRSSARTSGTHVRAHASATSRSRTVRPRSTARAGATTARTHATKTPAVARTSATPRSFHRETNRRPLGSGFPFGVLAATGLFTFNPIL